MNKQKPRRTVPRLKARRPDRVSASGCHIGQRYRGAAASLKVADIAQQRADHGCGPVSLRPRAAEVRLDQHVYQVIGLTDLQRLVLHPGTAASRGDAHPVMRGLGDHAGENSAVRTCRSHADRPAASPVQVAGGAVDGVNKPGDSARARGWRVLFSDDRVVGSQLMQGLADGAFGFDVCSGDKISGTCLLPNVAFRPPALPVRRDLRASCGRFIGGLGQLVDIHGAFHSESRCRVPPSASVVNGSPYGERVTKTRLAHPVTGHTFASPVPPGSGWPGDLAKPLTPVAASADDVRRLTVKAPDLPALTATSSVCRACPRLVAWREAVAADKRKAFAEEPYWGRPVTGWGSERPTVVMVGLAPAAHGGNRTWRIFTGDRSGDWLFASLHRVGMAMQATSVAAGDGQQLVDARMVASVRCAPPDNAPTPLERDSCAGWLDAELRLILPCARAVVCLGGYAWDSVARAMTRLGFDVPRPRPRFSHGASYEVDRLHVIGSYHPSQQNTFTGKLTERMLDEVLAEANQLAGNSA